MHLSRSSRRCRPYLAAVQGVVVQLISTHDGISQVRRSSSLGCYSPRWKGLRWRGPVHCVIVSVVFLPFLVLVLIYVRRAGVVGVADYWCVANRRAAVRLTVGRCVQQAYPVAQRDVAVNGRYC